MKHYIELLYNSEDDMTGTNDNFSSKFDISREFNLFDFAIFLKSFFYKVPIIDADFIDKIMPVELGNEDDFDEEEYEEELMKKIEESKDDIDNVVEDDKNLEQFKKQIQNSPEMAKDVFKIFLKDTLE